MDRALSTERPFPGALGGRSGQTRSLSEVVRGLLAGPANEVRGPAALPRPSAGRPSAGGRPPARAAAAPRERPPLRAGGSRPGGPPASRRAPTPCRPGSARAGRPHREGSARDWGCERARAARASIALRSRAREGARGGLRPLRTGWSYLRGREDRPAPRRYPGSRPRPPRRVRWGPGGPPHERVEGPPLGSPRFVRSRPVPAGSGATTGLRSPPWPPGARHPGLPRTRAGSPEAPPCQAVERSARYPPRASARGRRAAATATARAYRRPDRSRFDRSIYRARTYRRDGRSTARCERSQRPRRTRGREGRVGGPSGRSGRSRRRSSPRSPGWDEGLRVAWFG